MGPIVETADPTPRRDRSDSDDVIIRPAPAPFNDERADVILRSKDGVDFRVYKLILSLASGFFCQMFDLPQPPSRESSPEQEYVDGVPVVPMLESADSLENVLRLCYPGDHPALERLVDVRGVLDIAIRFEFEALTKRMRKQLVEERYLLNEALSVFAIACRHELEDEARLAARYTLRKPLLESFVLELHEISGAALFYLFAYHKHCSAVASAIAEAGVSYDWLPDTHYSWFKCDNTSCPSGKPIMCGNERLHPTAWWTDYVHAAHLELKKKPCGESVKNPVMLEYYLQRAFKCTCCQSHACFELRNFSEAFAKQVDDIIGEVELALDF